MAKEKETKVVKEGKVYKSVPTKETITDFDKTVFKESLKKQETHIHRIRTEFNSLKEELKNDLNTFYKDLTPIRTKLNKLLSRSGLEKV